MLGRRTLLKWMGSLGAAIAGEIVAPAAQLISVPEEALILPASAPAFRYDCLLNAELMKLNDREFHEAFVGPGIAQMLEQFRSLPVQPNFLRPIEVAVRGSSKRIKFPDGKIFLLERSFTPSYGHAASLYAMVAKANQETTE